MANEPDMSLISDLYEEMDRKPPAIEARKLLAAQFITAGWMDDARGAVEELSMLCSDDDVKNLRKLLVKDDPESQPPPPPYSPAVATATSSGSRRTPAPPIKPAILPSDPNKLNSEKESLIQGYTTLRAKAKALFRDSQLVLGLRQRKGLPIDDGPPLYGLEELAAGRITTVLKGQPNSNSNSDNTPLSTFPRPPDSARAVAKRMQANPTGATALVTADLDYMLHWLPEPMNNDIKREMLAKRVRTLNAALPKNFYASTHVAMMHMDHECLDRKYVNDETMLGDTIAEIPRALFYATEDNYAWSMDELVQAITSNNGVFRNPLSKHMFTPADISAILQHPLGKPLAALSIEQGRLKKGVRAATVDAMEKMAKAFMEDMEENALESRNAVDEFLAFLATLPDAEQQAIDKLSVPAKDTHTGQAFDGTIGEAVRDAKANKLCFHKAGDLIQQAVVHLRKK
ncbi:hypothetical protein EJ08DRAFT_32325 [Tothia fuscella]|uniref:Uncharacterized protein n=1 Tax=Tothia fuscella TaxID=1048955 RepID=A0A9P4TSZ6_9PEZI|nr:hypothetical protein EJ08DRAFT_32325 [Tothia fuscella]